MDKYHVQAKGMASMIQAPKDSHVDNNYKHMPKICQRYAKYMPGVIPRLHIEDNYLKQRYAKDMPGVIPRLKIQDNYLLAKICQIYVKDNYLKQ